VQETDGLGDPFRDDDPIRTDSLNVDIVEVHDEEPPLAP
jgi:hypothetical protein